ncbi:efflux RND transporter periplasmic adaptor subunit [Pseudorhodoplanes sp.]|uniref:efflux RND transporter periplasmic adaptor subunit n=1 Tax=Pseudorhodoplanes sp. TaxID=1934341 RepID=UPI002D0CA3FA|nr:efflux RND transporter periplasmic adaptor subunit [Pseudorhodoplanes sp.]HWV41871.1 efflux RND transporter periplasmic adaptor subunit [Pseudorhodoplanes sp.]
MRRTTGIVILIALMALGYVGYGNFGDRLGLRAPQSQQAERRASPAIPVTTVAAEQGTFPVRRRSIGLLESPAVVVVRSRIDSQMLEKHVTDGQLVREGELLFTLDDRELRAAIARNEAQLAKDEAARDRANADLKRTEELLAKNVAARQQLDEKVADAKAAEATIAADKAQLENDRIRLGYTKITAPITGRLGTIRVTPGNLVSASDTQGLVTITQIRPIRVSFTLPERDLGALRAAARSKQRPVVRVYASGGAKPLATGELDFVDSSVDTATGTIMAKATFANEDFSLWPGMYVDVEIDLDTRPDTVSIPTVALQSSQKGPFVFVVTPDERAELRLVETGGIVDDRTAIREGLKAGERVVVEGQLRLADGARVRDVSQKAADRQPAEALASPAPPKQPARQDSAR